MGRYGADLTFLRPFSVFRSRQFDPGFNRKYVQPSFAARKPVILWRGSLKWEQGNAEGPRARAIAMSDAVRARAALQVLLARA